MTLQEGDGIVCDLCALEEEQTIPAILSYIHKLMWKLGAHTLSAFVNGGSRFRKYFQTAGFYPRERSSVLFQSSLNTQNQWILQPGDRDS